MPLRSLRWFAALSLMIAVGAQADPVTSDPATTDPVMSRVHERGTFVAAAVPDQLPLAARDPAGNLQGFDIEVAQQIAKRLGAPVRFVTPGWDVILSGGWDGNWDFTVSSITPTPRRQEHLDFPAVYRMDAAVVVVRADESRITRPQEASGKTIGVKEKTTFERYLRHELTLDEVGAISFVIDKPKIKTFPDKDSAMQALVRGKVDAVVTSLATAEAAKAAGAPIKILSGFLYFEPVAVATAKGNPEFDRKIADAVKTMRDDGTLSSLSTKWFGIDLGSIFP